MGPGPVADGENSRSPARIWLRRLVRGWGSSLVQAPATRNVAIVYHYLAHYREAVFAELSRPDGRHSYVVFADRASNIPSLATIPPDRSRFAAAGGRLNWRFLRNIWLTPGILWQSGLLRIAAGREFDTLILLGNMQFLSTWAAALLGRLTGKRVLMWTHGVLRREGGLRGFLRRCFYRLAHGLLLYGHRARDLLIEQGFAPEDLYVVYNSLDTAEQLRVQRALDPAAPAAVRAKFGVPPEATLLLSIGRMTDGKDLDLLPQALAALIANGHDAHVVFVGGGPARPALEAQAAALALSDRIHFAGEIYAESELCPLLTAADLCVCPGPIGLTAMHVLAYGLPVITHGDLDRQKPEVEAIKPGVTGALFRRGDVEDLARTIESWLASGRDREALRQECRSSLLRFYTAENQRRVIDAAVDGVPARAAEPSPAGVAG